MQRKRQKGHERRRARQAGQGLVEYALVLVLVAVVCIAIMFATGLSVQRVYGVVASVLGAKHDVENYQGERIVIEQAECVTLDPGNPHYTGLPNGARALRIRGFTNVPIDQLSLVTDNTDVNKLQSNFTMMDLTTGEFKFDPILSLVPGEPDCPNGVTIQSIHGAMATSPIRPVHISASE
jgi:Flp pilus assembly pilin Flp